MINYLFIVSRPRFWFYLAGPFLVGAVYGVDQLSQLWSAELILNLLFFLIPANLVLYGVNDLADEETDRLNPKKQLWERGLQTGFRRGLIAAIVTAVVCGGVLNAGSSHQIELYLAWLILSIGYSLAPLRFKARPFIDSISNVLYLIPGVIAYVMTSGHLPDLTILLAGTFWCMAMHAYSAIPDIKPDREARISTIATKLGRQKTLEFCLVCWSLAAFTLLHIQLFLGAVGLIYPILVLGLLIRSKTDLSYVYWWFPKINMGVGFILVFFRLWFLR